MKLKPLPSWRGAVVASDLPAPTKHVALTLSLHMNERGESCFPSLKTLAEETSRGKATVVTALALLESAGFLHIERGGGRKRPNHYEAVLPETVPTPTLSPVNGSVAVEKGSDSDPGGRKEDVTPSLRSGAASRRRDPLWDELALVLGDSDATALTDSERGRRNKALKELRGVNATPAEIQARASEHLRRWPDCELTASSLAANWNLLGQSAATPEARADRRRRNREQRMEAILG